MVTLYMKIFLGVIILLVIYQTIRYSQSTTFHMYNRRTTNEFKISSWSCEVDRRLIVELQEEIRSKDKLLKYRERVIGDLRTRLKRQNLSLTVDHNKRPSFHIEKTMSEKVKRDEFGPQKRNQLFTTSWKTTPFPPDLDKRAFKTSKPCCIALKRMTDILRSYMQRTNDLTDQVTSLENNNLTSLLAKMAKLKKWNLDRGNCSIPEKEGFAENERDSLYASFDRRFVYEAVPAYTDIKRKIGKNGWGIHMDVEMNKAYGIAVEQLKLVHGVDIRSLSMSSGLVKNDFRVGVDFSFTINSNSTNQTYFVTLRRSLGAFRASEPARNISPKLRSLINIIVPLAGRADRLKQFLDMIHVVCIKRKLNIFLTIVIYGKNSKEIKNIVKGFSKATGFQSYDILRKDAPFVRGRALHDGVMRWNGDQNVTMFFCDVDITFDASFLQRCALYTEPTRSIYFPVVFSLYNPEIVAMVHRGGKGGKTRINRETGVWRSLGYGMVCVSRSDYISIGGLNLEIEGWGGEDVDLYQKFIRSSLKVIRAPDRGLFHKYHPKECDFKSLGPLKYNQCLGSKARYEASQRQLGLILFSKFTNATGEE